MFIPNSGSEFFHPENRIRTTKNLRIYPKKLFLSSRKYDPSCSSRILICNTAPQKYACFLPRATRERAEAALGGPGAASGAELTQRWRAEWEAAYPDLDMDWKQLMSRYNYHFGSERRESVDAERTEAAAPRFAYF